MKLRKFSRGFRHGNPLLLAGLSLLLAHSLQASDKAVATPGTPVPGASKQGGDPSPVRHPRSRHLEGKKPSHPAFTDFFDADRWTAEHDPASLNVRIYRGEVEKMWSPTNLKVAFLPAPGNKGPGTVFLRPPNPVKIDEPFDTFSMWIYSEIRTDKKTGAEISAEFTDADGKTQSVPIPFTDYPGPYREGWNFANFRLPKIVRAPATFNGFKITNITQPDVLYWDSPTVYRRGQDIGAGKIPEWSEVGAPTTPDTILPILKPGGKFSNRLEKTGEDYIFSYAGSDENIAFIYRPATGTLSDLQVRTAAGVFHPAWEGGWVLVNRKAEQVARKAQSGWVDGDSLRGNWDAGIAGNKVFNVDMQGVKRQLLVAEIQGNTLHTLWRWERGSQAFDTTLDFTIKNKSLIIDAAADTTEIAQFSLGAAAHLKNPILTQVPYLTLWNHFTTRPGKDPRDVNPRVLQDNGIFYLPFLDWYHTGASEFFGDVDTRNVDGAPAAILNGGSAYYPKTDGTRNPAKERIFLNVSSKFDEVLPNIANPPNPSNEKTKSVVWATRAWYALNVPWPTYYDQEYAFWHKMYNYGARDLAVRYHVSSFRSYAPTRNGDPYAFESTLDPRIGGGDARYARFVQQMQNDFGFRTGHYVNYTMLSPVNPENWREEWVNIDPSGQLNTGGEVWAYVSKVSRIQEMQAHAGPPRLAAWQPTLSYSDQLTAHPPWRYVDYDASTAGAGQFAPVIRTFAKSMKEERGYCHDGPVLSEGIHQWFYAGFCDSYAQTTRAWYAAIPNFQLGAPHLLSNDCGFLLDDVVKADNNNPAATDFVLANEILFGNVGHLLGVYQYEPPQTPSLQTLRSYFMIQQLQQYYANEPVEKILYFNGKDLVPIEKAIPEKSTERGMVYIRYTNGLEIRVNCNPKENWSVQSGGKNYLLPPNGWVAELPGKFLEYSAIVDGHRVDFVHGPQYSFFNANGRTTDFGPIKTSHAYVIRPEGKITQIIPVPQLAIEEVRLDLKSFRPDLVEKGIEIRPFGANGQPLHHTIADDGKLTFTTVGESERFHLSSGIDWKESE